MSKSIFSILFTLAFSTSCQVKSQSPEIKINKTDQESIIEEHLKNGAYKHHYFSLEWQEEIDKGLAKDSTIAYLWQQKAMPLFKQRKYEIGMEFIDKAVKFDKENWQPYRAFIKCIFAKTYEAAIIDFQDCKKQFGNGYVMDHSYDFYIALSYLQLNKYQKAEKIFKNDIEALIAENGEGWVHHLDLFYYGISKYEQKKYIEAIEVFDWALRKYPNFSDAQHYKAICHGKIGEVEKGKTLYERAKLVGANGTINEDNAIYELYPYQIRWNK